ncbi:hypothetical protein ABT246_25750 [Streptomyces sp. NPDC001553]|uniref:hypothetical protein n=1 Tax=Streptomyces sp. NPDC001553 TaxID=3154385 RepID=UPI00331BB1BF
MTDHAQDEPPGSEPTEGGRTPAAEGQPDPAAGPERSRVPSPVPASRKPARRRREPVKIAFGPVENGLDYLISVTKHLKGDPSPRDLKYAILHLAAAAEVLLKARLQGEHWSLVFEKPETATRESFDNADFRSCGSIEALDRLQRLAQLDVGKKGSTKNDLQNLIKWRNALQHYGLTTYTEGKESKARKTLYAPAVEKLAANLLDFLLTFVRDELRQSKPPGSRQHLRLDEEMREVSRGLSDIKMYLTVRWSGLRAELEPLKDSTVQCPTCLEFALLCNGTAECRFCGMSEETGERVADEYVDLVQEYISLSDPRRVIHPCPECEEFSLVADVEFASERRAEYFCFTCGIESAPENLASCEVCETPIKAEDGLSLCPDCLDARIARF